LASKFMAFQPDMMPLLRDDERVSKMLLSQAYSARTRGVAHTNWITERFRFVRSVI
jgi:hypothetical protein